MAEINISTTSFNVSDMTIPDDRNIPIQYVTETRHAISFGEIAIAIAGFIFLAYWLVRVSKNKEYYTVWKNPNGKIINLYKTIKLLFYGYTAIIIILGLLQIYLTKGV